MCVGRGNIGDFHFEVEGTNAEEVERVAKAIMEKGIRKMSSSNLTINLQNSTIGILNAGEIENVQSISVNVSSLVNSGHDEVAKALKELTEAVASSSEISPDERAYVLENLEELSKQAALLPGERAKSGVLKSVLSGVASTLGAAGGLAEVWSTWGSMIRAFFGL
ncbi:MAG TPA: hypothetical protein VF679_11660 [Pedobacter sp.]